MSTDPEIIRTIGYITDDRYIASYHGVDVKRVIALRKQFEEQKAKAVQTTRVSQTPAPSGANSDSERKWNANAKEGSAQLLKALLKFFANRERRLREQANV